jgi:hypothetical protein
VTGPAVVVVPKVWESIDGAAQFSLSPLGHIVYVPGSLPGSEHALVWVDRNKVVEPLAAPMRNYSEPRLSQDGRRLAVTITQNSSNIWIYDIPTGSFTQLTFEGNNSMPVWTLDGIRLAFASNKAGALNLFWKQADGSGTDERLATGGQPQAPCSWSPGSHRLLAAEISQVIRPAVRCRERERRRRIAGFELNPRLRRDALEHTCAGNDCQEHERAPVSKSLHTQPPVWKIAPLSCDTEPGD